MQKKEKEELLIQNNKNKQKKEKEGAYTDASETVENKKKSKQEVTKAIEAPPLGSILDKRTEEIRNVIFTEMAQNGIPASLMDYMLTSILAEVRDLKAKEYSNCIISKEE